MSGLVTVESASKPGWRLRVGAVVSVAVARPLGRLSPGRLCRVLEWIRRGARPARAAETLRARNAVVAVSMRCAGRWCLQRSIATVLLCRLGGCWPEWRTGVRVEPFRAHAWVAVDGIPIGEDPEAVGRFHPIMTVPPVA